MKPVLDFHRADREETKKSVVGMPGMDLPLTSCLESAEWRSADEQAAFPKLSQQFFCPCIYVQAV